MWAERELMEADTATLIEKENKDRNTQNFTSSFSRRHFETLKATIDDLIEKWDSTLSTMFSCFLSVLTMP